MTNERDEILMSQLADGELPSDQANDLLLNVLDDSAGRQKLKELLRLRRATVGWRTSQPQRPVVVLSSGGASASPNRKGVGLRLRRAWRMGGLAVAACIGGLLVLAGVWAAGWLGRTAWPGRQIQIAQGSGAPPTVAAVTPEQMQQVAKVFALHESVAGPLAWYAADDQNIRLAPARGAGVSQQPIAVLLRLQSEVSGSAASAGGGQAARTLVIVCRNDQPAVIELPAESSGQAGLRVYLEPRSVNDEVQMQYAITVDETSSARKTHASRSVGASISGHRHVGLAETSLGQLALGETLLNVEAAAWAMGQERN